ncbi:hypothetical protein TWF696_008266 [Orbilia brochopaga]|uniref:Aminoglycoside phosphotransferase domain-containing protein n=1 Tax=Orbilia brochopaga TaxID=3140254 RepID=A0AAV9UIM5_9PEZI
MRPLDYTTREDILFAFDEQWSPQVGRDWHMTINNLFVKYDGERHLWPQYKTQQYLYAQAIGNPDAPRIPKPVDFFSDDSRSMSFMVMECVELVPPPIADLPQRAAAALEWLRRVPVPSGVILGRLGDGHPRHDIFDDYVSDHAFRSLAALERYLNHIVKLVLTRPRAEYKPYVKPVSISHEPLEFTQARMDSSNFRVDMDGRTCLFGFDFINVLPRSFAIWTMSNINVPFIAEVDKHLKWGRLDEYTVYTLANIRCRLVMSGGGKFGLDDDGYPVPRLGRGQTSSSGNAAQTSIPSSESNQSSELSSK